MSSQQTIQARFARATASFSAGNLEEARQQCEQLLQGEPGHFDALHLLGVVALRQERVSHSILLIEECLRLNDRQPAAWQNLGNACLKAGDATAALGHFDRALELQPENAPSWNNRGSALLKLRRSEEALQSFERALQISPTHLRAMNNCGKALLDLQLPELALVRFQQVLVIDPQYPEALCNQGIALLALRKVPEALQPLRQALALRPTLAEALTTLIDALMFQGDAFGELGKHAEALASYEEILQLDSSHAPALTSCGNALIQLNLPAQALERFGASLKLRPDHANTLNSAAAAFIRLDRHDAALECFERLYAVEPEFAYARGNLANYRRLHCDWRQIDALESAVVGAVRRDERAVTPFAFLAMLDSPADQLQCGRTFSRTQARDMPEPLWHGGSYGHDRLRIACVSGDLRAHPLSFLLTGVLEQHDRKRFEVYGISLRPAENTPEGSRVAAAFDHFVDVSKRTDREIAGLLRELEADVVIDLMGHTLGARTAILSFRAAPVQIQYLGLPGTMGSDWVDYVIGDEFLIPERQRAHYHEQLILMPHSFQANDNRRAVAAEMPTRAEAGLPEQGFVFCSFNNTYKLNPQFFSIWMRLLLAVPGSVLWLASDSERTRANLRREAEARDVDPARLVFAPRVAHPKHLARLRHADLFLDSLPFNAGATASDALWAGVPVLTCSGESFAARMAGSLLHAVGLGELVARDADAYERLALELAGDGDRLPRLRARLAENIHTQPLFDTPRFTRYLEAAFTTVLRRAERGDRPSLCIVEP